MKYWGQFAPKSGGQFQAKKWGLFMRNFQSMNIPADELVLFNYVETNFPNHHVSLVYDTGCCGFSSARYFLEQGWDVLVVNPADVPRTDKQQYMKTDLIDSRNLSKQLKAGQLNGIYIPDMEQDLLKSLLRQKAESARQLRNIKSQIKALLLYHGINIPVQLDNPNWTKAFVRWINDLQWVYPTGKECMDSKLRVLDLFHSEDLHLANRLRAYCRKHYNKDYYLLKSIPGIGGYLAAAVLAEIGDLRRFTETEFASYVGIVPQMRNSGGKDNITGVTPRCRALLRSYIIESAWVAYRLDPQMQKYYRKHIGKNPKSIIVKVARKQLNRMLSVIKNENPYQLNTSLQNHQIK